MKSKQTTCGSCSTSPKRKRKWPIFGLFAQILNRRVSEVQADASLTSFEVALLYSIRANGPAVYLAQPIGLGFRSRLTQGLKARPVAARVLPNRSKWAGPLVLNNRVNVSPSPLGWARQMNGALPLSVNAKTSKFTRRVVIASSKRVNSGHEVRSGDSRRNSSAGSLTQSIFAAALMLLSFSIFSGCESEPVKAASSDNDEPTEVVEIVQIADPQPEEKPARLKRGEMPEEWIEPQRERLLPIDTASDSMDLTFDDLKFDIEIGQAFERSLLSEEVKALDGKEITLGGYMKPSFKASGLKGFVFVRDNKECCFGPQAAIYDCVMVRLAKGTKTDYLVRPFKIRGTLYLKEYEGPDGTTWAIFNMKNAKVE